VTRAPAQPETATAHAPDETDALAAVAMRAVEALRVERRSTASLVSETLRDSIIRGELPPGTPLREQALSDALDVSRNTVREALRLLDHEGLVDYQVNRGVTVRQLSESDVQDLYRTREALEVAAIHYGAAAPREALEALSRVVDEAEQATAAEDWRTVATLDIVFHQQIVELIGSERITAFFRRIVAELRLGFAALEPTEHKRYVGWNRELVTLLLDGKLDACAAEMRAYLASAEEMVQRAIGNRAGA
jgi:DNA-binding GntR family transcriptional regulator